MSLNLVFKRKNKLVDFPFQTPTTLTKAVLACQTREGKLVLVRKQLVDWEWHKHDIDRTISLIKGMLLDETLTLTFI